jgi:molybdopterin converting factor subunit 1
MRIEVLYFAILRERARLERETLDLPEGTFVTGARSVIAALHPEIAPLLSAVQTAVNRTVVGEAYALSDGDEMALLPPVSGGA